MRMLRRLLPGVAFVAAIAAALVMVAYARAMDRAYERIRGRSDVLHSPVGDIEYSDQGSGPPVLVIHGSGGGFDQGEFLARAALGDGFRRIAPSRFGYLRSTFHPGATFDDQAQAYALLLEHLGIPQVAVLAFSHGGPSALLFALLYPQRVSSLTLLSAGVGSSDTPGQQQANRQGAALMRIFQHDVLYWAVTTAFRHRFLGLMGADDAVVAGLTPQQQALAGDLIDLMNPVSPRAAGTVFDNRATMPGERIAAIRVPTLILHARDDTLQLFHHAEFAVRTIPGARLEAFDRGGHLLVAVEQAAVRTAVRRHVLEHRGAARQDPR
jgi:2-hydroxy-6-oxonona-2,4-dienedioate hydrolase